MSLGLQGKGHFPHLCCLFFCFFRGSRALVCPGRRRTAPWVCLCWQGLGDPWVLLRQAEGLQCLWVPHVLEGPAWDTVQR